MKVRDWRNVITCTALALWPLCSTLAADRPQELACLDRFDIDRYVIGCWAWPENWHPGTTNAVPAEYWEGLARDGFNAIVIRNVNYDNNMMKTTGPVFSRLEYDLDFIHKLGIRTVLDACHMRVPRLMDMQKAIGGHPAVLGYWLSDNCDLHSYMYSCAGWLERKAPNRVPWMSTNPNPIPQSRMGMPIISSQNYPYMYRGGEPEQQIRSGYCDCCESDRLTANLYDMAPWMVFAGDATPSQYRFQLNASAAYGAQGSWLFGHGRYQRMALGDAMREANRYLADIAGPHLLGRRSVKVLHSGPKVPPGQAGPGPGKLVEAMDDHLLVGLMVPDSDFQAGRIRADGLFIVDKRTKKFEGYQKLRAALGGKPHDGKTVSDAEARELTAAMYRDDPQPRRASLVLSSNVHSAEALLPDGTVLRYDLEETRRVELPPLRGGGSVLLRIRSAPIKTIRVPADTVVQTPPARWRFCLDPKNVADKEQWATAGFDDSEWKEIRVPYYRGWSSQGYGDATGAGWYRVQLTAVPEMRGKRLYLHFGGADEQAWVFADGQLLFEHTCGSTGLGIGRIWTLPFHGEVTSVFGDGKPHTLAVKVANNWGTGGLSEPVHLIASREALDADQLWRVHAQENKQNAWLWQ